MGLATGQRQPETIFSQIASMTYMASSILEEVQGANENIQQFVARYKSIFMGKPEKS